MGSEQPFGYFLLFFPVSFPWLVTDLVGEPAAAERTPAEEVSLASLVTEWRSFMKRAIGAEVSANEETCGTTVPVRQLFVFLHIPNCMF